MYRNLIVMLLQLQKIFPSLILQVIKLFLPMLIPESLFADDSDTTNQTLLTFTDGTSFIPTATQTAIDIEKSDDGTIKLLTYREAGEAIKLAPKRVRKINRQKMAVDRYLSASY